jgi:hypothetical protein
LQKKFGDFIRTTNSKFVLLANQHLDVVQAMLLFRGPPKISTKIGRGWREFCRMEGYQTGDTIRFKFSGGLTSTLMHVRKI